MLSPARGSGCISIGQRDASSSRCSAARRPRGRSRRARSRARACGASGYSCLGWRTTPKDKPATQRSCNGSANWAGSSGAMYASTTAGAGGAPEHYHVIAAELIALSPDVILALGYSIVSALQKATRSVPIVFAGVTDPVGGGLVASLARPGGNTTGFVTSEFGFAGKWL